VIGNWKMNPPTISDAVELARNVADRMPGGVYVGVAPAAIALPAVADALREANVDVYAQDVHWEERGAFTGQVSVSMVRGLAVGTLVGHSEVRRDLGDTDARVAKKLARAISAGLRPVLCVGESAGEHAAGEATVVVARQIAVDVAQAERRGLERLIVAYEPVWAIGTGKTPTTPEVAAAHAHIRKVLGGLMGEAAAVRLLYGGSVKGSNAGELLAAGDVDGALIGGASLKADEFLAIAKAA
jgi:triosephosphate isomerase